MKKAIHFLDFITKDIKDIKEKHNIIGFTNGCFDLLHAGHLHLLESCKKNCDYLIVGLNSDESVTRLKGTNRPIERQDERYKNLIALKSVDNVFIFIENTPITLIEKIKPDIIFKGSDYLNKEVVGEKFISSYGGKVQLISLIEGISTSEIIRKRDNL